MFGTLMEEVESINAAYGWVGSLDAITFMQENRAEYTNTQVGKELDGFMRLARDMMAPAEPDYEEWTPDNADFCERGSRHHY